jgi:hypothetical protein
MEDFMKSMSMMGSTEFLGDYPMDSLGRKIFVAFMSNHHWFVLHDLMRGLEPFTEANIHPCVY